MPTVTLAQYPTPLEPAPRLAAALGLGADDLWIKRDDLLGPGGGGNKIRKLEWLCGAAIEAGATTLVTSGAAQSNHARLTAAAGARLGLDVVLVLAGAPDPSDNGNIVLDGLFGARIVWAGTDSLEDRVAETAAELGEKASLIPFGGTSLTSVEGYASCADEIVAEIPAVTTIVTAVGSGGTMAGLVRRLGAARVLGVDCGAVSDPVDRVVHFADLPIDREQLRLRRDLVGEGYAVLSDSVAAAMTLVARTEGLVLDPVYSGRAAAGLVAAVEDSTIKAGERTVLLHTGGLPGLFGHRGAVEFGLRQAGYPMGQDTPA
ncbi:1-aminocyclopropane-1-carboxylate deaminase [Rhodococcus sp. AW25M09]|uniref:pyridoxal-phosphate dependent enzyme n=1 Tax=Rhodococcus sp. AW25M09 TaxID=1268303 RepID=UPI0002AC8F59|nr:pyridoxal-phosphate dependent enzyme [Rhodococcus sp. AW25M09]CCQ14555.1 1-aminocyclopropane-1-carboxylate deaminase [Rhodococcus sp. AW25M09]